MFRSIAFSIVAFALAGCATAQSTSVNPESNATAAHAHNGAVSAADPRAQTAGEEILRLGGNATDAAIATMIALTVVEPQSSGIGGGGFLVLGTADGTVTSYDGRETAPAAANPAWFLNEDGSLPPFDQSVRSGLSVGVPGNIALAAKAHTRHGKLPWADLFRPAIRLAREGFAINPRMHNSLGSARDRAGFSAAGRALFYDEEGNPRPVGYVVRNEQLARTFEMLAASGPQSFYKGPLAEEMAATVAADTPRPQGMTVADIGSYSAREREALCGSYRGYRICGMGPPTSGGVAVLQILGQLERFDLGALGVDNPTTWHLFLESQRLAYADRELYLADSDFVSVPVKGLVDPAYLARRSALINADSSIEVVVAGVPEGAQARADGNEPEEHGTTHFAVVDSDGTMASYTSTIEGAFGSGLMVGGFFLNNELTDFSRAPVVGGITVANRVEGGKRPRSSMAPTVVWDPQGRPFLVVGAAGGGTIPVQTARSIIGVIDFGLPIDEALGLPFAMAFGKRILLEQGTWLEGKADAFRALGHAELLFREAPVKSGGILRTPDGWQSARDPRLAGQLDTP